MSPGGETSSALRAAERLIAGMLANDPQAGADALDPRVTWHHNLGQGTPLEGTYHGSAAVRKLMAEILEAWEVLGFDDATLEDDGDRVVHSGQIRMRGRESGVELSLPSRIEMRVADDRIVETWMRLATGGR